MKIGGIITFCNSIIDYETPCILRPVYIMSEIFVLHVEHFQRVRRANKGRFILLAIGPVQFWTSLGSMLKPVFFKYCHYSGILVSNIMKYSILI